MVDTIKGKKVSEIAGKVPNRPCISLAGNPGFGKDIDNGTVSAPCTLNLTGRTTEPEATGKECTGSGILFIFHCLYSACCELVGLARLPLKKGMGSLIPRTAKKPFGSATHSAS